MKKLMSFIICIAFFVSVSAQKPKDATPAAAKSAFAAKYPTA